MSGSNSNNGVTQEAVMRALATVQEPELHRDLVTLNMIHNLTIHEGEVSFTIMLTTPACPLRNVMERDATAAVQKVPGVTKINVRFDAQVRTDHRIMGKLNIPVKNIIAVASGKGGVGKSTVSTEPGRQPRPGRRQGRLARRRYLRSQHPHDVWPFGPPAHR